MEDILEERIPVVRSAARLMLRGALFLALADARNLLRAKETVAWIFVMPALFFYFIGTVTGGMGGGGGDTRVGLAVELPPDAGFSGRSPAGAARAAQLPHRSA